MFFGIGLLVADLVTMTNYGGIAFVVLIKVLTSYHEDTTGSVPSALMLIPELIFIVLAFSQFILGRCLSVNFTV